MATKWTDLLCQTGAYYFENLLSFLCTICIRMFSLWVCCLKLKLTVMSTRKTRVDLHTDRVWASTQVTTFLFHRTEIHFNSFSMKKPCHKRKWSMFKLFSLLPFLPFYFPFSRRCELSHPAHTTCLRLSLCQTAELYEYRIGPLWQDKLCRKLRTPPSVFATVIMCDQIFMHLSPSLLLSDIYRSIYLSTLIVIIIFLKHIMQGHFYSLVDFGLSRFVKKC